MTEEEEKAQELAKDDVAEKKVDEALAKKPETENALALSDAEQDDIFGSSTLDKSTPLYLKHYKIVKDSAEFEVGPDERVKKLVGHVLYKHCSSKFFKGKFNPSEPSPPDCYSTNGVKPDGGEDVQCTGICVQCEKDKYGSGDNEKSKACKNYIQLLFLPDGAFIPVTISASAASLGKNSDLQKWLDGVVNEVSTAYNKIGKKNNAGEPIVDFWWAKVEITLVKKTFSNGEASAVVIKTLGILLPDSDENMVKIRSIHSKKKTFTEVYNKELRTFIEGEADEAPAETEPEGGYDDEEEIPV